MLFSKIRVFKTIGSVKTGVFFLFAICFGSKDEIILYMYDSLQLSDNVHEAQKIHCFVKKYTTLLIDKLTNKFCLPYEELVRHARSSNGMFPLFLCGL